MKYISTASDIPKDREVKLINTFLECRIGREVSWCNGVSQGAISYYEALFKMLTEDQIKITLIELKHHMASIYNRKSVRAKNTRKIIDIINRSDLSDRLREIINYIIDFDNRGIIQNVYKDKGFKDLSAGILDFS